MNRMRIFPKTFLYTISLLLLITLIAHALIFLLMPSFYRTQTESMLQEDIAEIMDNVRKAEPSELTRVVSEAAESTGSYIELFYQGQFIRSVNVSVATPKSETLSDIEWKENYNAAVLEEPPKRDSVNGTSFSKDTITIQTPFAEQSGSYLLLEKTMQPLSDASQVIISILPFSIVICFVISAAFSLLYSRTITSRIRKISEATDSMVGLEKTARCSIPGKDEIGALGENINGLYSRLLSTIGNLETSYAKMRAAEQAKVDFLRAASHELKTPITAINITLENMILGIGKYQDHEAYLPKLKEMTEQLSDMVHNFLEASKLDRTENISPVPLNVSELVQRALQPYAMVARAKKIEVECHVEESLQILTSEGLLVKALSNIISNAVHYNHPGGYISIHSEGNSLFIVNTGEAIADEHLEHIFEPFYRPDFARDRNSGGNGLGLYIVHTIMHELGYSYSFTPIQNPEGMKFEIEFS